MMCLRQTGGGSVLGCNRLQNRIKVTITHEILTSFKTPAFGYCRFRRRKIYVHVNIFERRNLCQYRMIAKAIIAKDHSNAFAY